MGLPLYIIYLLSLVAFNILSLWLIFIGFITMCLDVLFLGFILPGTLCTPFPMLGKFPAIISSNILLGPFSFFSSSGTPIMWMFVNLMLSQRYLGIFSFVFNLFFNILFYCSYFHCSVLHFTYQFFCLCYSAIDSF